MVRIQRLPNGQLVITIPKRLAELKGLGKGTELAFRDNTLDSFILMVDQKKTQQAMRNNPKQKEDNRRHGH